MNNIKPYLKYIGIGGCIIALIGVFIPWISALGYEATLSNRLGVYLILLLITTGILFYLESPLFTLVSSLFAIVWFVTSAITIFLNGVLIVTPSVGFFVLTAGLLITLISAIVILIFKKKGNL